MEIIHASESDFSYFQEKLPTANFLQSIEISHLQKVRGKFIETEALCFKDDDQVVGLAVVNYRKKWKLFKEAIIVQGPVFDYTNSELVSKALDCLESHVARKKATRLICHPYLINNRLDENLDTIRKGESKLTISIFKKKGYQNSFEADYLREGLNQAFIKDISNYPNYETIERDFDAPLKCNIKKFRQSQVLVKELDEKEIHVFYDILLKTSDRKDFAILDLDFFDVLKRVFKSRAKFMLAYLDCAAYQDYLLENVELLQKELTLLQE